MWNDLKFALRQLRKSPGFTVAVVVTLALGIGANTAVFSLVHAILLRQLPFAAPTRIVAVKDYGNLCSVGICSFFHLQTTRRAAFTPEKIPSIPSAMLRSIRGSQPTSVRREFRRSGLP